MVHAKRGHEGAGFASMATQAWTMAASKWGMKEH